MRLSRWHQGVNPTAAPIPFVLGSAYQLWLVAFDSKGHSIPGSV